MKDPAPREETIRKKGGVIKSDRGLQIWGDEAAPDDDTTQAGDASQGTAERQAKG